MTLEEAYETLDLASGSDEEAVRRQYKFLVRVWHPDRFEGQAQDRARAEDRLKAINLAFATLRQAGFPAAGPEASFPPRSSRPRPSPPPPPPPEDRPPAPSQESRASEAAPRVYAHRRRSFRFQWSLIAFVGVFLGVAILVAIEEDAPLVPAADATPGEVRSIAGDYAALDRAERDALESLCAPIAAVQGRARYEECVQAQLALLRSIPPPDLSALDATTRPAVDAYCAGIRRAQGPARGRECLHAELNQLRGATAVDLAPLDSADRDAVESFCSPLAGAQGPAKGQECLRGQLEQLRRVPEPDLTAVEGRARHAIEAHCATTLRLQGLARYRECVQKQIAAQGSR